MNRSRFSTADEAFSWMESFLNLERTVKPDRSYRLDRMRFLLDLFDHPERSYGTIHVAGSKGKGSTSMFLASILDAAGYRTGLYMSPHVVTYRERITEAGRFFPDRLIAAQADSIRERISELADADYPAGSPPTTFELLTLLGFLVFRAAGCERAVIETGIGGRLDATNTVLPDACVITLIELEHTDLLGSTLEAIASEKAGIMKSGVPVFLARQRKEAEDVLLSAARALNAPVFEFDREIHRFYSRTNISGTSASFSFADGFDMSVVLSMYGDFQAENAAIAARVVHHLLPDLSPEVVVRGLGAARLPGRMELLGSDPPVMIDAAHTPSSVERLLKSFREIFPKGGILIFGSVLGKDYEAMARILAPAFRNVIISRPGSFKKSDPAQVYRAFRALNERTVLIEDPKEALSRAKMTAEGREPVLVTGSFYMISGIRSVYYS